MHDTLPIQNSPDCVAVYYYYIAKWAVEPIKVVTTHLTAGSSIAQEHPSETIEQHHGSCPGYCIFACILGCQGLSNASAHLSGCRV